MRTAFRLHYGNFFLLPGYLLFFLMLFVPTTYKYIKVGLLLLVAFFLISSFALRSGRLALHRQVLLWTLFIVTTGIFFILWGLFKGAPGALRMGTVYVLWPMLFTVLDAGASNERVLRDLTRILVIAVLAIGIYDLSYILYTSAWLPEALYIPIDQGQAIGFYKGFMEYNLYHISSLLFLVPFLIAAWLTWTKDMEIPVHRFWILIALVLGLMISFLSARRALILVIAIAPIITLFFHAFLPYELKKARQMHIMRALAIVAILFIGFIAYLDYSQGISVISVLQTSYSENDISNSIRKEQFFAMLEEVMNSPLLGAGLGATVPGVVRDEAMPWAYELSYMALLFNTGLLGFLAYAIAAAWIFWKGLIIISSEDKVGLYMLPTLVGMSCFLIANATNPYLSKFDYMWVIFFPLAFINFWLLKSEMLRKSNSVNT